MLEIIEKLLVLQDRDRQVIHHRNQLKRIGPEREALLGQASETQQALEEAKTKAKTIESSRKKLELDAESKQELIKKYSKQQFQTKKNEEYQALANEIKTCRQTISELEDQQLELMEEFDQAQAAIKDAEAAAKAAKDLATEKVKQIDKHEANLKAELKKLLMERNGLAEHVDASVLANYERLLKYKGENSVVGVDRGICAGCHVKLPIQIMISCKAQKEIVTCPNCGRIVYFADGMQVEAAE
ncbi:MAG: hypothetical protein M2R45_03951 [Verrucomicrobia subdivision 3 bacterium]|nr:hypothetical protein [Limisphaerales bacterium]MCS1415529.1 hypothetical protein [Limisphaerales bacterium]